VEATPLVIEDNGAKWTFGHKYEMSWHQSSETSETNYNATFEVKANQLSVTTQLSLNGNFSNLILGS
jgi:hypothetical protein